MSRRLLLVASVALVAGFAPAPLPRARRADAEGDDLRKMQGTWVVTRYERDGTDEVRNLRGVLRIRFEGNRLSYLQNGLVCSRWDLVLMPRCRPRALAARREDGQAMNQGIYRFDGEKLIICESEDDGPRPTEFTSKGARLLIELRR